MTAAKLPATTARRKAVVMAYSMRSPQIKSAPSRAKKVGGKIRPHQVQPGDAGYADADVARTFGVDRVTMYRLRAEVSVGG
jgi:hypothetical protein